MKRILLLCVLVLVSCKPKVADIDSPDVGGTCQTVEMYRGSPHRKSCDWRGFNWDCQQIGDGGDWDCTRVSPLPAETPTH